MCSTFISFPKHNTADPTMDVYHWVSRGHGILERWKRNLLLTTDTCRLISLQMSYFMLCFKDNIYFTAMVNIHVLAWREQIRNFRSGSVDGLTQERTK